MNAKNIWIICLFLGFLFGILMYKEFNTSNKINKLVSGAKSQLPKLTKDNITVPPVKSDNCQEVNINSKAALLIDNDTFNILYQKNPDEKVPIASTTKIMTSLVVLEDYPDKLKDVVTITPQMINIEGSDLQLRSGEKITVENLLKGLLIVSGNDAAYSLAYYLGGKDEFVKKMNDKAGYLGMKNTLYKDPAGLDDTGYSNAKDLAIVGAYAIKNKKFAEIVKISETRIVSENGFIHDIKSSNRLIKSDELYYFPFAIGIKTGFTNEAGHCLVSAAQKDGHKIISVVLNTNENTITASAKESRKLLDWGVTNWKW